MPEMNLPISDLGSNDQPTAFRAFKAISEAAARASAPGHEAEREALAAELARQLNARTEAKKDNQGKEIPPSLVHSARVRQQICRLMALVAGPAQVPALVEALSDLDVREMARYALSDIPGEEATAALVKALEDCGPVFRTGVINSLGRRMNSREALKTLQVVAVEDTDSEVKIAAIEALANFPEKANDAIIGNVATRGRGRNQIRAQKARLRLADTLARAGQKDAAQAIYKAIAASNAAPAQKKAAELALKA